MKYLSLITVFIFTFSVQAAPIWTDYHHVGMVYTYSTPNSLHVYLDGETCPNQKNYFSIQENQNQNAKQLISMVLTAKAMKKRVNFYTENNVDSVLCYVKGMMVEE
ncbi:MAG: hypothetical protein HWE27_10610 [Gammaproteobacteria bacterium]|nr:hypothetical protein [Gammaproteobacteria bacterium]